MKTSTPHINILFSATPALQRAGLYLEDVEGVAIVSEEQKEAFLDVHFENINESYYDLPMVVLSFEDEDGERWENYFFVLNQGDDGEWSDHYQDYVYAGSLDRI